MLDFNLLHAFGSVPAIIYIASLSFVILLFLCIRYYVINKNQRIDFLKYKIELDQQNSNLKTENNKLIEKLEPVTDAEAKAAEILSGVTQTLDDKNKELIYLEEKLRMLNYEYDNKKSELNSINEELGKLAPEQEIISYGLYAPQFDLGTSEEYKNKILYVRDLQKQIIKNKTAATCSIRWKIDGDLKKGKIMIERNIKLMLKAFNGEADSAISSVRWNNYEQMLRRIRNSFININKLGEPNLLSISEYFRDLKERELMLAYEYQAKRQEERDEQAQIREQMREEERARKEIEQALKEAEDKEEKFKVAIDKVRLRIIQAKLDEQRAKYEAQLMELEQKLKEAIEKKQRAQSMAEQTRRGHVYIISNVGSFGDGVYKIGMTRRLEPFDRVRELGDASVPFPFDVHAMIWSEDAPALESDLHRRFMLSLVNKVNYRKEFFKASLQDIKEEVEKVGVQVQWTLISEASQYRKTLAIEKEIADKPESRQAWLNRQLSLKQSRPISGLLNEEDSEDIDTMEEVSA